ncbi:MAG TPA: hypothetical protein VF140_10670 [Phycicoccus sp.]
MTSPGRAWLLLPAGASLLAGLDAGLVLLGGPAPVASPRLGDVHGPLMVLGFLGTLIALERAAALRAPWGYAAPVLLGLGGLTLAAPLPRTLGQVLLLDGCVALAALLVALWRRRHDDSVLVEVLAAVLAALAALLWIRVEASAVVPLLAGFVVLTIAAERVELAGLHLRATAPRTLVLLALPVAAAATASVVAPGPATRAFGVTLLALVAWLAPRDVAVRLVRTHGLPRFAATAMLVGYTWLALAGAAWVVVGATTAARAHDLVVHAVFLGFAMSMVLAHAPVILPAVIRRAVPYRPAFWLPHVLLHAALTVRVVGDVTGVEPLVVVGGTGTALAILVLPATAAASAALAARRPAPRPSTALRSVPS